MSEKRENTEGKSEVNEKNASEVNSEEELEIEFEDLDESTIDNDLSKKLQVLEEKLKEKEKEIVTLNDRFLRLKASNENDKKRILKESDFRVFNFKRRLFLNLIGVIDNFERALTAFGTTSSTDENYASLLKGNQATKNQLDQLLERENVVVIKAIGENFDPNLHEAVLMEETNDVLPNTVLEELAKGYKLDDKVIRAAVVKVSKKPTPPPKEELKEEKIDDKQDIENNKLSEEK